jgi:hypothetical protein
MPSTQKCPPTDNILFLTPAVGCGNMNLNRALATKFEQENLDEDLSQSEVVQYYMFFAPNQEHV